MNPSHQLANSKYENLREGALTIAQEFLASKYGDALRLRSIDAQALLKAHAWEATRKARGQKFPWSFTAETGDYKFRHPDRLDLAVWTSSTLCSLAIGIPTKTAASMRLDVLEASPEVTPLTGKVLEVNLVAFEAYANAIGATSITLMRPLNDRLINYYRMHGFMFLKSKGSAPARMWRAL